MWCTPSLSWIVTVVDWVDPSSAGEPVGLESWNRMVSAGSKMLSSVILMVPLIVWSVGWNSIVVIPVGLLPAGSSKSLPTWTEARLFQLHSIMRTNSTTQRLYGYFIIVIVHHRCNCFLLRVASASMSNSGIKGFSKYSKRYASYFINYAVQYRYSCVT